MRVGDPPLAEGRGSSRPLERLQATRRPAERLQARMSALAEGICGRERLHQATLYSISRFSGVG